MTLYVDIIWLLSAILFLLAIICQIIASILYFFNKPTLMVSKQNEMNFQTRAETDKKSNYCNSETNQISEDCKQPVLPSQNHKIQKLNSDSDEDTIPESSPSCDDDDNQLLISRIQTLSYCDKKKSKSVDGRSNQAISRSGSANLTPKPSNFHLSTDKDAQYMLKSKGEHSSELAEAAAFSNYINSKLKDDPLLTHLLPLNSDSVDIFTKNRDGLILIRLINRVKEVIDMKPVNKDPKMNIYQQRENLNAAIAGASKLGCQVSNIGPSDIVEGR
jgi:hypothetical protein